MIKKKERFTINEIRSVGAVDLRAADAIANFNEWFEARTEIESMKKQDNRGTKVAGVGKSALEARRQLAPISVHLF